MRTASEIKTIYDRWVDCAHLLSDELIGMDAVEIENAFYRDLSFGTGGLRGLIGAGTNRMNIYTVAWASQGLANYLKFEFSAPSVVIGYDSRIKSDLFAKTVAAVFAANGLRVNIWPELLPVPMVSYAVRCLHASAGIMITASHNPSKYNGYKVYGTDGCQITTEAAAAILTEIEKVDIFDDIKSADFGELLSSGKIKYISGDVYTAYIEEVKKQSTLAEKIDRDVAIVYSPLNGTGLKPVTEVLRDTGFTNITVVAEQEKPDGNFPTCPYPNPEIHEAMELGLQYCERTGADLLLATDPDCDRCGIAVKGSEGYQLLSGNEVGLLLLDFICSQRLRNHTMPNHPVFVKTIVTTDLAERIAEHYGVQTTNVLTGFKFIGEVIGRLEKQGCKNDFICGFEESYGYLTGDYVRDKDGVNASFMICEMYAYYKSKGIGLLQKLDELYRTYGYCMNTLYSYEFDGPTGMQKMQQIMADYRVGVIEIGGKKVEKCLDYLTGIDGLPKSDVLKFLLEDGSSVVIRPSGTEPKLKVYVSVMGEGKDKATEAEKKIIDYILVRIK